MHLAAEDGYTLAHTHLDEIFSGATVPFKYLESHHISALRSTTTDYVWDILKLIRSLHLLILFHVGTTMETENDHDRLTSVEALHYVPFLRYVSLHLMILFNMYFADLISLFPFLRLRPREIEEVFRFLLTISHVLFACFRYNNFLYSLGFVQAVCGDP